MFVVLILFLLAGSLILVPLLILAFVLRLLVGGIWLIVRLSRRQPAAGLVA